jgi:asparagine synthase (glutamine-hydrolysing)
MPVPTDVEVLANLLVGPDRHRATLPPAAGTGVGAALERAVLPALLRPPCLVSFSGGRDSSAVLAVATDVARRHGLPEPVPAIMRFPSAPATDESEWQRLVLDHLGLADPEILELDEELDALGPIATAALRAHGVRWPGNGYMHAPLLDLARGGSLLTGAGGDELFGTTAARHLLILHRRVRPGRGDLRALAAGALPRWVRVARRRRGFEAYPWLTERGNARVCEALALEDVAWPARWDRAVHHWYRSRAFAAVDGAVALLGQGRDVLVRNPFLDPGVLGELIGQGGPMGFASRAHAMQVLFGDLLPDELLARPTKARFSTPLWGPAVRAYAEGWHGEGIDDELVRVVDLRREWRSPEPDFRTILLLQTAWLSESR